MKDFFATLQSADFWLGFCIFMLLVLGAATIVAVNVSQDMKERKFAENGYEQVVLPGSSMPKWQKVK